MVEHLTLVLRTYTRAFVSQGVGIIGLVWCLVEGQAALATALTVLVLADQALFLRGRMTGAAPAFRLQRVVDGWCIAVSVLDVVICFTAIIRSSGLRDGAGGPAANSPLDSLAYVLATLAHGSTALVPATAAGRLLGAVLALCGPVALLLALVTAVLRPRRADTAGGASDRSR
jgi:hypothetical protein